MNYIDVFRQVIDDEASAITALKEHLTDEVNDIVQLIYKSTGRVIVTGIGKSGLVGNKISATLASTGTPSFFIHPVEALHGDLGMIMDNDVVLAISNSGMTDELLRIVPYLKKRMVPIISMTGDFDSLLAKNSDFHIYIGVKKEACPLNLAPTSSTTATIVMGDALAVALMRMRNFKKEDFAKYHPAGNLGYRLLTRVGDIMITANLPIVSKDTKVCDAIYKISDSKLGLVIVQDVFELYGIVTDGDVRRAMQKYKSAVLELNVSDIMTTQPICVTSDCMIVDAEHLMLQHQIHSLIVKENNKAIGIVDYLKLNKR